MSLCAAMVSADRLSSTGWGECVFSGICGRMAETKSLWEEPDTGYQLTQDADSTDRCRVARRSHLGRRSWHGLRLRIDSP
jgi:hypothetical protein